MEALSVDQVYGELLDHLGLVAATIQECGLMDTINDLIPVKISTIINLITSISVEQSLKSVLRRMLELIMFLKMKLI